MLVGEWPGKDEAKTGRVFVGKNGREIDRFLDGIRLPARYEWYLTSWIREWCGEDGEYTADDFARDLPDLETDICACQPRVIVALGRNIARWFLGDIDLEETFGIAWKLPPDSPARRLFDSPEDVAVFVGYNPAAGFRSPDISARIAYQFARLESVITGETQPRTLYDDPIPHPEYRQVETVQELEEILRGESIEISTDSEGWPWNPWSVQLTVRAGSSLVLRCVRSVQGHHGRTDTAVSGAAGVGVLDHFVRAVNRDAEAVRCHRRDRPRFHFNFHNALHDLAVFRAVGIDTRYLSFDDTMLMAYALGLEPQGLKPLCLRWCNMRMEHYDEVMGDADIRLAQDWLLGVLEAEDYAYQVRCEEEFVRLTTTPYVDKKGKTQPGRRLKVHPKLPRTDLHKSIQRCIASKNPRKLWGDQVIDRHVAAEAQYGAMWEATLDHVPQRRAIAYAGRDSDGTHRLKPALVERLRADNLLDVYRADLATVPLIDRMQRVGVRPDLDHFARLSTDLGTELQIILASLHTRIGDATGVDWSPTDDSFDFNPNSGDQTSELLFGKFGIESLKRTPGGDPSTNDKVLEALEKDQKLDRVLRDIISDIRQYREVYKLKHTFVDKIPDFVNRWPYDGRIHSTFRITRVVTGRLAASDPNLLALPKHGKFAKRFRSGFVGRDDTYIASWDLSQIELRVLAHLSQDPVLLDAFRTGKDLHAKLAQRIFGGDEKNYKKGAERLAAKAINFGIPMGMTPIGLCLELRKNGVDVTEDDAARWLAETMALYVDVPRYQADKIAQAKQHGYVTDIRGRRRYIGGIRSYDEAVRSEAERFSFSTPIQAGAQEIMKEAEAYVYSDILLPAWERRIDVEPLVQIHDDLVLESDRRFLVELDAQMVYAMTQLPAHWLSVPIETSGDFGFNWGDMVPIYCGACHILNSTMEHKTCSSCGSKLD